ncbi:hypothetical protein BN903_241 [Halorubrum sp. AJ67]|nr:hypothetical protein BN903_241 [Halorubrum sp. AJ67]
MFDIFNHRYSGGVLYNDRVVYSDIENKAVVVSVFRYRRFVAVNTRRHPNH